MHTHMAHCQPPRCIGKRVNRKTCIPTGFHMRNLLPLRENLPDGDLAEKILLRTYILVLCNTTCDTLHG